MHDELEGCFKEHLSCFLRHLLTQAKLISLPALNKLLTLARLYDINTSRLDLQNLTDRDLERLGGQQQFLSRKGMCLLCFVILLLFCCNLSYLLVQCDVYVYRNIEYSLINCELLR